MKTVSAISTVFAAFVSLALPAIGDEDHIGDGVYALPLFDAHIHYKEPAWDPYPPETVLKMMDDSGVAMGLVSSTPDEGTIKLWRFAPNRIVPELRPYFDGAGSSDWTRYPGMFDYIMERLDAYPHEGIGEFHLHSVDPGDKVLLANVARVAKERNLFIHVHSGWEPVEYLYSLEPSLNIIWAHAGMSEPPAIVERMMEKHDNLFADTSYREHDILGPDGTIDPDWRRVLERFPDRFMVGSDTWVNSQWGNYGDLIATNRQWLRQFSRSIAEKIAFKNAERLFGRAMGRQLIGQR